MFRRSIPLFSAALVAANAMLRTSAHPKPDFSGRWIMDTVRSHRDGVLSLLTLAVRRSGDTIYVQAEGVNAAGTFSTSSLFDLTGRSTQNTQGGAALTSSASWRGDTLELTSAGTMGGRIFRIEDRWSLDRTGSELTRRERLSVDGQGRSEVLVLRRAATPTAFLTTIGKDTFCFEQYTRRENVVWGTWVVLHPPGVFVHDYRITLSDDGLPLVYTMKYSTPGAPTPPGLDSVSVTYGRDSATLMLFRKDATPARRIAAREAFPLLGQSYVGVELALERLRRARLDSATVMLNAPTEPNRPVMSMPIRFFSDSAMLGPGIRAQIAADGSIQGLRAGPMELRRVAPFDASALVTGFVRSMAPRMAAVTAAIASRKEIAIPAAQLDRFAGAYAVGNATITVAREGEHLTMRPPGQPATQLLAMSATEFFVQGVDLVISFESDSSGRVAGLTIAQGEAKQRLVRRP